MAVYFYSAIIYKDKKCLVPSGHLSGNFSSSGIENNDEFTKFYDELIKSIYNRIQDPNKQEYNIIINCLSRL